MTFRTLFIFLLFLVTLSQTSFAQTPSCSSITNQGNSYKTCTSGICEHFICDGSSYVANRLQSFLGTGNIDFGYDTSTCNTDRSGRLRYDGTSTWEYCNGTSWTSALTIDDDIHAASGITIGTNNNSHKIDNSANGLSSSTLYIGSQAIMVSISDRRLKNNIEDTHVLPFDVLNKLRIVDFDWISKEDQKKRGRTTGLIAQDVYEILPQIVNKPDNPQDYWSVEYHHLVPYVVKALQDLKRENDILHERLATLENQQSSRISP